MNSQSQSIYQRNPSQPEPIYQTDPAQSTPMYQTAPAQSTPIYQTSFQQPPSYATVIVSSPYAVPIQHQPPSLNNNQNLPTKNPTDPGTPPFEKNKWPRKSVSLVCPRCGATVTTRVEAEITMITMMLIYYNVTSNNYPHR
ncbi:unnamed protein product [Rotaria sp. Silwood2]|nr:unnamed protein product [Rotaria sp. Silwood2]